MHCEMVRGGIACKSGGIVEVIAPLVGNALITSVEGNGGYKHVVVEELLDDSTGFALKAEIGRTDIIKWEVTIDINSSFNAIRFAFWTDTTSFVSPIP